MRSRFHSVQIMDIDNDHSMNCNYRLTEIYLIKNGRGYQDEQDAYNGVYRSRSVTGNSLAKGTGEGNTFFGCITGGFICENNV